MDDKEIYINKECDSIALHYNIQNDGYVMDAALESESTVTFLQAVNYVSKYVGVNINIKTTSLKEGSVVRCFRFVIEEKDENNWLLYIFMALFNSVFFQKKNELDLQVDLFNDKEKEQLLTILKRKQLTKEKIEKLGTDYVVAKHRSDFFKRITKNQDIQGLFIETGKKFTFEERAKIQEIAADEFKDYIVNLFPEEITLDNACVYIISPVILKGQKTKWRGVFENRVITFELKSNEFKTKAQNGLEFRSGSNIICTLKYKKTIDGEGKEYFSNYQVIYVLKYGVDDHYVETLEGQRKRIEENTPGLFDGLED